MSKHNQISSMLKNMSLEHLKNIHKSVENLLSQTTLGRDGGVMIHDSPNNLFSWHF